MTENFDLTTQTDKINVFTVKRYENQFQNKYYSQSDKNKDNCLKIENFIICSIGSLGYHKNGHYVKNLFIRCPFNIKHLFLIKKSNLIFNFPSYIKKLAENSNKKFLFYKIIYVLKNVISNKAR